MDGKLAEELIQSNEEYTKLRARRSDGDTRKAPARAAGAKGLGSAELRRWTTEDLRSAAATLGVPGADTMQRDALVETLVSAELASVRGR